MHTEHVPPAIAVRHRPSSSPAFTAPSDMTTPEAIHRYDGGYTEYVERTGHEAPGLHP